MSEGAMGYARNPFVAEFYDHLYAVRGRRDIEFWVSLARESGGPVLELGCGTGRVLVPIAREGVEIVGLDLAAPMLAACRGRLGEESEKVRRRATLVQGDMCAFEFARQFELITSPFRSFQHLETVDEQVSCLRAVARHLAPQGRFVLDVFDPSLEFLVDDGAFRERDSGTDFTLSDGRRVVVRERVQGRDHARQLQHCEMIYYVTHPDGRTERLVDEFTMRHFFRFEAEHLLARCGLAVQAVYGDYDRSPYQARRRELIVVAGRR